MKYMLLIQDPPGGFESFSRLCEEERQSIMDRYFELTQEPGYVDGAQLQPPTTATTIRVEDGRTLTTDGPFAESKEHLGGYYIFDVENLDQAIELASRVPVASRGGAVEIRPLVER